MLRLLRKCSAFLVLALAAVAQNSPEQKPPAPVPIPQMSPEELPARAARVSYRDGMLLIDADNASLAGVLGAVGKEMGAEIDMPPNADRERVVVHLSGAPHRVIADLLDGGKFGFIILSPANDAEGIQKLIVTREAQGDSRPGSPSPPMNRRGGSTPQAAQEEPGPTPEYPRTEVADRDADAVSVPDPPASQPQQAESPKPAGSSEAAARPVFSGSDAQKSADPAQNPGPTMMQEGKPPMEVMQDLYRMRQQLQQQRQPAKPQ